MPPLSYDTRRLRSLTRLVPALGPMLRSRAAALIPSAFPKSTTALQASILSAWIVLGSMILPSWGSVLLALLRPGLARVRLLRPRAAAVLITHLAVLPIRCCLGGSAAGGSARRWNWTTWRRCTLLPGRAGRLRMSMTPIATITARRPVPISAGIPVGGRDLQCPTLPELASSSAWGRPVLCRLLFTSTFTDRIYQALTVVGVDAHLIASP